METVETEKKLVILAIDKKRPKEYQKGPRTNLTFRKVCFRISWFEKTIAGSRILPGCNASIHAIQYARVRLLFLRWTRT